MIITNVQKTFGKAWFHDKKDKKVGHLGLEENFYKIINFLHIFQFHVIQSVCLFLMPVICGLGYNRHVECFEILYCDASNSVLNV